MAVSAQLCGCGSGLRAQRCCAYDFDNIPPPGAARQLLPLVERAANALKLNQPAVAEQLALEVLELAPVQPGALNVLYRLRRAQNTFPAAETLLRRFVRFHPNELDQTAELALMLKQRGNIADAEVEGFDDTMAVMAGLDLVLTVDTSVAHLAGAMGVPVWIMLPWCAEWRWLQERTDSPWYPTARLFRQPEPNDWQGAAEQIAAAISARE